MEERKLYDSPQIEVAYFETEEIMTDSNNNIELPVVPWNPNGDSNGK